jgi:hypothetical protein
MWLLFDELDVEQREQDGLLINEQQEIRQILNEQQRQNPNPTID